MTEDPRIAAPVVFGREICGNLDAGVQREWLVTNGIGGYASGTLAGMNTRRYHALLVAALNPPLGRTVLVGSADEWVVYNREREPLSTQEYRDGWIVPRGYVNMQGFRLDGQLPVWTFAVGDALLERTIWMPHGKNTTYVCYRLLRASGTLGLEVTPMVTHRDFHNLTSGEGWAPEVYPVAHGAGVRAGDRPFRLLSEGGSIRLHGEWYWHFFLRQEKARGLNDTTDLYTPGVFSAKLAPGQQMTLIYTAEDEDPEPAADSLAREQERQRALLARAGACDPLACRLVLAADQFIVRRDDPARANKEGCSIIAGYPWFGDWGRDTMIALPGLTLATGRAEDAARILRIYARYVADGLLPNTFPDTGEPAYNTADASLWFILAALAYQRATGDEALINDLLPAMQSIIECYREGTRYGIRVDDDGLLQAGEQGTQVTWMDAKVGDWVVTPRTGKPVEVNALWYNALRAVADLLDARDHARAAALRDAAEKTRASFVERFHSPSHDWLADVVDGPYGDSWALRPNQIFAVSLPYPLVEGDLAKQVVESVGRELLVTLGLRTLERTAPGYVGSYGGDVRQRDGAYHQGTAWTWLIGPFAEAYFRVTKDKQAALGLLEPFLRHFTDAGLGSISEILNGDAPFQPDGAPFQAWSVGEVLRVWTALQREG